MFKNRGTTTNTKKKLMKRRKAALKSAWRLQITLFPLPVNKLEVSLFNQAKDQTFKSSTASKVSLKTKKQKKIGSCRSLNCKDHSTSHLKTIMNYLDLKAEDHPKTFQIQVHTNNGMEAKTQGPVRLSHSNHPEKN